MADIVINSSWFSYANEYVITRETIKGKKLNAYTSFQIGDGPDQEAPYDLWFIEHEDGSIEYRNENLFDFHFQQLLEANYLILKSPDGTKWKLKVSDTGTVSVEEAV